MASHEQFDAIVLDCRRHLTGISTAARRSGFLSSMYYVLGWCVGDFGKDYGNESRFSARISLELTKKHPENLVLGQYVTDCINALGIECRRYPDRPPKKRSPSGTYFWKSAYSPVIGWFHKVALGLLWEERTTRHPVRMEWILKAPLIFRIWFLRGVADSDANVNVKNRIVEITTSPNTEFFQKLFDSIHIRSFVRYSRGYGYVAIRDADATRVGIFNPRVPTHRRKLLEKLSKSRAFQRHWPAWLEDVVQSMIRQGLTAREIRNLLLEEKHVYVKMRTIKLKVKRKAAAGY